MSKDSDTIKSCPLFKTTQVYLINISNRKYYLFFHWFRTNWSITNYSKKLFNILAKIKFSQRPLQLYI